MNKRLIIIGNGFDLDHGLNTRYSDFKRYLLENKYSDNYQVIPSPTDDGDGEEHFDVDELKNFLFRKIQGDCDDEWNDFEERRGYLDFSEDLIGYSELGDNDGDEWHDVYDNEDNMNDAFRAFSHLTKLFIKWLNEIVCNYGYAEDTISSKAKPNFSNLLTSSTKILNFNYTKTVENLYKFNDVKHIHGTLSNLDIILGHSRTISESGIEQFLGAENTMEELEQSLYKNTDSIIEDNIDFFANMVDIEEVYTYGFSFSKVDMPYIFEIIKRISSNATWFLHGSEYEAINGHSYKQKLKSSGFVGTIR